MSLSSLKESFMEAVANAVTAVAEVLVTISEAVATTLMMAFAASVLGSTKTPDKRARVSRIPVVHPRYALG